VVKRKVRISVDSSDDIWTLIRKLSEELQIGKPRKRFGKWMKLGVLADQNYRCKLCWGYLEFPEYDHIDGDRTNNEISNCQALCPNCHARKTRKKG